jgi:hypothetical protein
MSDPPALPLATAPFSDPPPLVLEDIPERMRQYPGWGSTLPPLAPFDPTQLRKSRCLQAIRKHAIDLRDHGVPEPDIRSKAHAFNQRNCKPPCGRVLVDALLDWIIANPASNDGASCPGVAAAGAATHTNGQAGHVHVADPNDEETTDASPWPDRIRPTGMYGIAGEYVRLVAPYTEADPNAILLCFLVFAGHLMGRNFFIRVDAKRHCGNLYGAIVGATATGRKGTAVNMAETFFTEGDLAPGLMQVMRGLSTGEGVMWLIRDPIESPVYDRKTKKTEMRITDPGIPEKRMIIILDEFQQGLSAMRRKDSILASTMRCLWDNDHAEASSKNSPAKVRAGAHVSMLAGISPSELLQIIDRWDAENGTLNRILWCCSIAHQRRPESSGLLEVMESPEWKDLQNRFNQNIAHTGSPVELFRDADAQDDWGRNEASDRGRYRELMRPRTGKWGAVTARAAQQVMRIALLHAVINGHRNAERRRQITLTVQDAAAEAWRYCDESARQIFSWYTDPDQDRILRALQQAGPKGLTRTEIRDLWPNKDKPAKEIQAALTGLARGGLANFKSEPSGGRPTERWWALETVAGYSL